MAAGKLREIADDLFLLVSDDERFFARLDGTWTGQSWKIREASTGAELIPVERAIRSEDQVRRAFAALSASFPPQAVCEPGGGLGRAG